MFATSNFRTQTNRFCLSENGTTGIIFSLALIPALLLAGAAIDYSRAIAERTELQGTTDAAVLAAGRIMRTGGEDKLRAAALAHLTARHGDAEYSIVRGPTVNADRTEICLTTRTSIPTTVMKLARVQSIDLQSTSCAKVGGTTFEVAIALDNTGSMSGQKLRDMKKAAKELVDQLLPAGKAKHDASISLIPFSASVRAFDPDSIATAGATTDVARFAHLPWIDHAGESSIHWENFPKLNAGPFRPVNRFELNDNIGVRWGGCFEARPGALGLTVAPASPANPDSMYVPYFAPDEGDNASHRRNSYLSDFGNSICEANDVYAVRDGQSPYFGDGQAKLCKYKPKMEQTTTPGTCKTVRVCRFFGLICRNETVCEPGTSQDTSAPMTLAVDLSSGKGPNRNCTVRPVTPLSTNAAHLRNEIDAMVATGSTNLIEGFMWAWKTLSPRGPYTGVSDIKPYDEKNHEKVIVFMSDGDNVWNSTWNANGSEYGPHGYFWNDRLGQAPSLGSVSRFNTQAWMDAKTLEACNNAKQAGIRVFTIAFSTPDDPISAAGNNLLRACADDPSKYYLATNATELSRAFQTIGDSLVGLHLSK